MAEPIPAPPHLTGAAVTLRALREQDLPAAAAAFAEDPELGVALGMPRDPTEAELREQMAGDARGLEEGRFVRFAVADRESDAFLGMVVLFELDRRHGRAETGFWLTPGARGRGVATEAIGLAVDWSFEALELHRVEMRTLPELERVLALAERLGFQKEGFARERNVERGRRVDVVSLAVLRPEWTAPASASNAR